MLFGNVYMDALLVRSTLRAQLAQHQWVGMSANPWMKTANRRATLRVCMAILLHNKPNDRKTGETSITAFSFCFD